MAAYDGSHHSPDLDDRPAHGSPDRKQLCAYRHRMATIRRATDHDAVAIATVLDAAFAEFRHLYTTAGYSATTPDAAAVRDRMREGPVWAAMIDDRCVGTASLVLGEGSAYLRGMAVSPEARGLGLATELLRAAEQEALRHRITRLWLNTTPFLDGARALYRAAGFVDVDDGVSELHGTPLQAMEKRL